MSIIDRIYGAVDEFGLITSFEAGKLGVSNAELVNQARRGKLVHVARGVYRMPIWPYQEEAPYAIAVKAAGPNAVLYGESVLALLGLVPTDPTQIWVATPTRNRKRIGAGTHIVRYPMNEPVTQYEGIPCQPLDAAIIESVCTLGAQRAIEAAKEASRQGYLDSMQLRAIGEEIGYDIETK